MVDRIAELSPSSAAQTAGLSGAASRKTSRLWWHVHQWVGLKLSILMSFILFTGTLAVFSAEIDWLIFPQIRIDAGSIDGPPNWSAMAEGVAAHAPGKRIISLEAPVDRGFAARATVETPERRLGFVYVHPETGAVTGDVPWVNTARILRNIHRHLMMPVDIGVPIVTSLALLLLVSIGTSFVVYKKWWRGFFKPIRWRDARTALGDAHRLAGVWSLWFVALMIATSMWYMVESLAAPAPPHPRIELAVPAMTTVEQVQLLAASDAAREAAWPDLRVERVLFPVEGRAGFVFHGDDDAILVRPRSNTVWTDPATGRVMLVARGEDLNVHQRISEMADPLHFGYFGGLPTKIIWFVFGLFLTGLSVSGVAIYALRILRKGRRAPSARAQPARAMPAKSAGAIAWQGMGLWGWLSIGLIAVSLWLIQSVFAQ